MKKNSNQPVCLVLLFIGFPCPIYSKNAGHRPAPLKHSQEYLSEIQKGATLPSTSKTRWLPPSPQNTLIGLIGLWDVFALTYFDATAKNPKNVAKTTPTLQNQGDKVLLTLASISGRYPCSEQILRMSRAIGAATSLPLASTSTITATAKHCPSAALT